MANKTIKGLTVEIGGDTTKLGKALESAEKKGAGLSTELGQINKLLRFDPSNVDLLTQKQGVLTEAIESTKDRLDILKEAERQVQEQFERGEASEEQVRAIQREIIETTGRLGGYERALQETNQELDRLGDNAQEGAESLDDVADSADDAEDKTDELGSTLDGDLQAGFTAVVAVATAAVTALVACAEATKEYRREMGKLDTAFTTNGHSNEAATETYKELQSILGETDQAVEAANHLALLADNEEELRELTHALTGVYATFGASLPLEGLTEAANESAKVGAVVGPLADAINWANASTEDWNTVLAGNNKALKAFKGAVAEGEAVEDAYSAALAACSDEQERQKLITATLTKLYGKAATQYKKTNKEVIRSNKANEEWTETMAKLGEHTEPVITDFKEFGITLAKDVEKPVEEIAEWVSDELLPALINTSDWVKNNGPVIKGTLAAVTTGFIAYKTAVVATEISQKGLKGAIVATEIAQKALNLAQAATPWGLAAVAISAVVVGMVAYATSLENATTKVDALSEEERELIETSQETTESLREQRAATDEIAGGITAQMKHVQDLATELQTLADKSGKVKESDQARVQFILNELNEALGTEYEMTDGIIKQYGDLKKNIDAVIVSKTANALLEAHNADYVAAIEAENELLQGLVLTEKDYQAQLEISTQAQQTAADARAALNEKIAADSSEANLRALGDEAKKVARLEELAEQEKLTLEEKKKAYEDAALSYGQNAETIMGYEEAQTVALQGNYTRAVEILKGKEQSYNEYAEGVDEATKQALDTLYREAVNAGVAAARTKQNFENGVEGYTKEMVNEAEAGYQEAVNAFADAKADAEGVGEDIGDGLAVGMEVKRQSVVNKITSIVDGIIAAARKRADSHSPSRKMIDFGEDMGEGAEVGIDNKTKDVIAAAEKQVSGALDVYQAETGQSIVGGIQRQTARHQAMVQQTAADTTSSKLDKILKAIQEGRAIYLDGETLVGGTADKTNAHLGQKRLLAERGATT